MALIDPNAPVTVLHPQTGQPIVLPAFAAAQFPGLQIQQPQGDIYLQGPRGAGDDGGVGAPPPPPPPPPTSGSGKGPQKKMIGNGAPAVDETPAAPATSDTDGLQAPSLSPMLAQQPAPAAPAPQPAPAAIQPGLGVPAQAMDDAAAAVPATAPQLPPDALSPARTSALGQQQAGLEEQKRAGQQEAQAQAEGDRAKGDAYAAELQRQDQMNAQFAQQAQAKLAEMNQRQSQINAAIDGVSKMKVDASISHPVLAAISLALGGLGAALNHSMDNPALDVLNKQIAQNVQVQMANIGNARAAIGMQQGQLANLRAQFTDQNALHDALTAAETRRVQTMVNQIAARSDSNVVKANAASLAGQLQEKAGALSGQALDQEQQARDRQKGFALQKRGQDIEAYNAAAGRDQAAKFHTDEMDFRAKQLEQTGNLAAAKMLMDKAALLRDGGMMAPTGKMITVKNPDGTTTSKPEFDWMRQQDGTPWIVNQEAAKELQPYKVRAATDHAIDAIDAVRRLRSQYGGDYTNLGTDANQKIAEIQRATMALMQTYGGNASPRSKEILDTIQRQLTGSADVNDKIKAVMPVLDQARRDIITDANSTYGAAGYNGDPVTYADPVKMAAPTPTAMQSGVKAAIEYRGPTFDPNNDEQRLTGESSGADIDTAEAPIKGTIDQLAQQMASTDPTARANATANLGQIIKGAANSDIRAYATNAAMAARANAPALAPPKPTVLTGQYTANRLPQ